MSAKSMRTLNERKHLHIRRLVWRNGNDNGNGIGIATVGFLVLDIGMIDWILVSLNVCRSVFECDGVIRNEYHLF